MWQCLTKQSDLDLFPVNRFCSSMDVPVAICIYLVSNTGFHRQEKNKVTQSLGFLGIFNTDHNKNTRFYHCPIKL